MKMRIAILSVLCMSLVCIGTQVYAQQQKITVLNPMGTPPPIQVKEMAPRMAGMDGKTLYLINSGYVNTDRLIAEFQAYFKEHYPKTNIVLGRSGMDNIQQNVLNEIAQKADGVIVALGH
jgi:hypothetical protein